MEDLVGSDTSVFVGSSSSGMRNNSGELFDNIPWVSIPVSQKSYQTQDPGLSSVTQHQKLTSGRISIHNV